MRAHLVSDAGRKFYHNPAKYGNLIAGDVRLAHKVTMSLASLVVSVIADNRPALRRSGIHEDLIQAQNNASLESQLLFLRKLNEFFKHLPTEKEKPLKEDDLRAEHYSGFKSPGAFLSRPDQDELHKRVGHVTLMEVRYGKKNWTELVTGAMPIAVDRLHEFFLLLA